MLFRSNASYDVNQLMRLPEGISGSFYVIVQADYGNAVNEFVLEGDNVTPSGSTFAVTRAPYSDIVVEGLAVTGPANDVFTINWNIANRGNLAAAAGFGERIFVRNADNGAILLDSAENIGSSIAVDGTLARSKSVTTTAAAHYQILITEDTRNELYEFDATSHAHAEQNVFEDGFDILPKYTIAVSSNPAAGGSATGGGIFTSGD